MDDQGGYGYRQPTYWFVACWAGCCQMGETRESTGAECSNERALELSCVLRKQNKAYDP